MYRNQKRKDRTDNLWSVPCFAISVVRETIYILQSKRVCTSGHPSAADGIRTTRFLESLPESPPAEGGYLGGRAYDLGEITPNRRSRHRRRRLRLRTRPEDDERLVMKETRFRRSCSAQRIERTFLLLLDEGQKETKRISDGMNGRTDDGRRGRPRRLTR
jgi:hypothetical protein